MPFIRPDPAIVDRDEPDDWCVDIHDEDCEPGTAQCPECGHFPDAGEDEHQWTPGGIWTCAGCGHEMPVIPCQIETEEEE